MSGSHELQAAHREAARRAAMREGYRQPHEPDARMSFRLYWRADDPHLEVGHVHVCVFASEFGPNTTHGKSGELTFRAKEWLAFRDMLEMYAAFDHLPRTAVEFIKHGDEPKGERSDAAK